MNRLERISKKRKLTYNITSFLGIVIGTFLFWLVGFAIYQIAIRIVVYLSDLTDLIFNTN